MEEGSYGLKAKKKFEKTYNRFFNFYFQIAFHFLHHEEDAREVVQEAFIKCWEKDIHKKTEPEIKNYLFIIVRNRCLNILRDRKNKSTEFFPDDLSFASIQYKLLQETGEEILLYEELSQRISAAIDNLPPQCRTVFSMSRYENLSNIEISRKLNISVKAVEADITRSLRKLRVELAQYLSEEDYGSSNLPPKVFLFLILKVFSFPM